MHQTVQAARGNSFGKFSWLRQATIALNDIQ